MTDDARVREIARIIALQDMGPGVSLGSRLAAGMFDYYPKDSQGREDVRKCVAWAINQVSRTITALPPQPGNHQSNTSAVDQALERAAQLVIEWRADPAIAFEIRAMKGGDA